MLRITIAIIISTVITTSCNNTSSSKNNTVTITQINSLENELFNSEVLTPDMGKARKLATLYIEYASTYPQDTLAPEFLFKASDIYMNLRNPQKTISLFDEILTNYPAYKNAPTILFLKGFVYEDQLNDYENARICYQSFIEKYPENDFADDAVVSINNLGKSPEEMIKEFETK